MITKFKVYLDREIITFQQIFPEGVNHTQVGDKLEDLNRLTTSFPSFQRKVTV
jgi:hypothetical protein